MGYYQQSVPAQINVQNSLNNDPNYYSQYYQYHSNVQYQQQAGYYNASQGQPVFYTQPGNELQGQTPQQTVLYAVDPYLSQLNNSSMGIGSAYISSPASGQSNSNRRNSTAFS